MKTAEQFLIEHYIEHFGTDLDSAPSEWELKAMQEYANQEQERAEAQRDELLEIIAAFVEIYESKDSFDNKVELMIDTIENAKQAIKSITND